MLITWDGTEGFDREGRPLGWRSLDLHRQNLGSDVFLCCPGPSLSKVNMDKICGPGRFVVAVNTAYPYVNHPDLWIGMDSLYCYDRSLWSRGFPKIAGTLYQNDIMMGSEIKRFPNMMFLHANKMPISEIYTHKTHTCMHLWNGNTFESILDILVWMGAKRINLLGCDFGGDSDYHDGRELSDEHKGRNKNTYQHLVNRLSYAAMVGKDYGVQYISCTEKSPMNNFIPYMSYEQAIVEAEQKLPKFVDNTVWDAEPGEMMRWSPKPKINQGVLTGCDKNHEWMISWWFANFRKHNPALPVCFVDMGMTPECVEWCKKRGLIFQQIKPNKLFFKKAFAMLKTPFEHTLFMDLDCEVRGSVTPLFEYGDAVVVMPDPYNPWAKEWRVNPVQTGVIAYKHGNRILDRWVRKILAKRPDGKEFRGDQGAFNCVISEIHTELKLADNELPHELFVAPAKYQRLRLDNCEFEDTVIKHWTGPEGKEIIRNQMTFSQNRANGFYASDDPEFRGNAIVGKLKERFGDERGVEGAEIGVLMGRTSAAILGNMPEVFLHMVDSWEPHGQESDYVKSGDPTATMDKEQHDKAKGDAIKNTDAWSDRRKICHETSASAASQISDNSLDFVFIDADHSYSGVLADLKLWWPKVKGGGIVSGHDWENAKFPGFKVKEALAKFANDNELSFDIEPGTDFTWFVTKPEGRPKKKDEPLVSIVMPAYKCEEWIGRAIESCKSQTYQNWELVLCFDGDDPGELINVALGAMGSDKRLRTVKPYRRLKYAGAFNAAVAEAKGEIIVRLDADDTQSPDRIELLVRYLQSGFDMVTSDCYEIDKDDNVIKTRDSRPIIPELFMAAQGGDKFEFYPWTSPTTAAWKYVYDNVPEFEDIRLGPDVLWLLEVICKGYKLGHVSKGIYNYRRHANQSVASQTPKELDYLRARTNEYIEQINAASSS